MPDEYPTEKELLKIEQWDTSKCGVIGLIEYVESLWKYPEYFNLTGKRILKLRISTGGWSGNEELIGALKGNIMFWMMTWQKSVRGGHYWFKWKREEEKCN